MTTPHEPPIAGSDVDTLLGALERQRRTFAWKCGGLGEHGLRARVGASSLTLGGLLKHLALVEEDYFAVRLRGLPFGAPWTEVDWAANPDWVWESAAADPPAELYGLWDRAVARSREHVADAIDEAGLDAPAAFRLPDGRAPSLRRLLIDIIEEYARHVGHADLIRESVDGLVGEDPPG